MQNGVLKFLRYLKYRLNIITGQLNHAIVLKSLKGKSTYKVVFFAMDASVWKYDYLYRLMEKSPLFDPIIVICPMAYYGRKNMLEKMEECRSQYTRKQYNIILAYNEKTDKYLDVKSEINPDIIFYTNPYQGLIDDRYYIDRFKDTLTCYVPYEYSETNLFQMFFNMPFHNYVWKYFLPTERHGKYSHNTAYNKGVNTVVTGYPGIDYFFDKDRIPNDVWKIKDPSIKRIIWAPHHTIKEKEVIHYSCFLYYYQTMLNLANKYKDKIQIAFKPHPHLKLKLYEIWGTERTDSYFSEWDRLSNGFCCSGDYTDLFLTSDAIIHDSGSFVAEYLYTLKPAMRTDSPKQTINEFNDFGEDCLKCYYHAKNESDIEDFILNVVINGEDSLKGKRLQFYNSTLIPPNGMMPSQNIMNYLTNVLR
jgi:hypothetical protein